MTKLCPRGKAAAKRKFAVYPSAYANAYASKICAGKIKDPSGVKRKDFKGPKPAGKKVGGMTAGSQSAMGRIQKARMMNKGGLQYPVIDRVKPTKGKSKSIRALAKRKGLPAPLLSTLPKGKLKKGFDKAFGQFPAITAKSLDRRLMKTKNPYSDLKKMTEKGPKSFAERRKQLAGGALKAAKATRVGKIAAGVAAAALLGKAALEKAYEKRTGKKPLTKRRKLVDKKSVGGMADYYKDLM